MDSYLKYFLPFVPLALGLGFFDLVKDQDSYSKWRPLMEALSSTPTGQFWVGVVFVLVAVVAWAVMIYIDIRNYCYVHCDD